MAQRRVTFAPRAAPRFLTVEAAARARQEHAAGRLPNHSLDDSRQDRPEEAVEKGRRIAREDNQIGIAGGSFSQDLYRRFAEPDAGDRCDLRTQASTTEPPLSGRL